MSTSATLAGRAAAILTTGEVDGATLDLSNSLDNAVAVELDFTIGSLTNVIVKFYGSSDNVTWRALHNGAAALTETLTATGARCYMMRLPGIRYFKVSVQGTGTTTSSSCAFNYFYQPYLTSTQTDGKSRLS